MATLSDLPLAKINKTYAITSRFSDYITRIGVLPLELPVRLSDKLLVELNRVNYQSTVGLFIKNESIPYCPENTDKRHNFNIVVRRGSTDYKLTVKDLRLEILRVKGVLK